MNQKEIAEKILKAFDNQFIDAASMIIDCRDLARAYLDLENNHIAAIALINKNISTLRMWTNPNSYLGSELLDLSNVNSKFLADNFTFQNSYLDLKSEITKLKAENEKLKFQSSIFNDTLKQNRDLNKKLRLANDTIHGEFCGQKCHPLHLEVEI